MSETNRPEDQPVRIEMSPSQLHDFFHRLATNDAFRTQLQENPIGTLAEWGIEITDDQVPDEITLPDKETLQGYMETWNPNTEFPLMLFNAIPFRLP